MSSRYSVNIPFAASKSSFDFTLKNTTGVDKIFQINEASPFQKFSFKELGKMPTGMYQTKLNTKDNIPTYLSYDIFHKQQLAVLELFHEDHACLSLLAQDIKTLSLNMLIQSIKRAFEKEGKVL